MSDVTTMTYKERLWGLEPGEQEPWLVSSVSPSLRGTGKNTERWMGG